MPFIGKILRPLLLGLAVAPLAGATALACPDLTTCKADEQMSVERDERGCNVVTCSQAQANQVDEYYQDIPQMPKSRTAENKETDAPVTTIEPLTGPKVEEKELTAQSPVTEDSKEKVATENPALAAPVADAPSEQLAAEPESQKQPVVESETPANEGAVATKNPATAEPSVAPEKAPRADVPAAPAAKVTPPAAAI